MKKVYNYSELQAVSQQLPYEFAKYLMDEFTGLYDYLSNGEGINEFKLSPNQAIVILEHKEEINTLIANVSWEFEFVEKVQFQNHVIHRIGIFQDEDVQLCYCVEEKKNAFRKE
ncbi:hypothetical protein PD280_07410 [Virgibacillus salarius]|uniref:hypothetical protein n=1 Tax=Virgibacillus salarius TaxID=447199 RepID=UPI002491AFF2|nr:hypothetical protein [Virgibacillus salarius]WBX81519.1 hypothetical protein PD280_07410 [Virgibacillus salarius]